MASVFTADHSGNVTHVDFWTTSNNAEYEIYVRDGYFGSELTHQTGNCPECGYYSIPLNTSIPVDAGQQFTVGVNMTTPGYDHPIPVEFVTSMADPTIQTDVSFVRHNSSCEWTDLADYSRNACLRARMVATFNCTCGDICVNQTGWWRDGSVFNANNTAPIQAAVDAATAGETIHVAAGSYTENVNIGISHLTLVGEGADVVDVRADSTSDHVFEVTADYVNISGFNVTGATGDWKAGIYLSGRQHCNISDNRASNSYYGIRLNSSSNNTVTKNNASNGDHGICMGYSSNYNMVTDNIADSNTYDGIRMWDSCNNNTVTNNTANSNKRHGIRLRSLSNNNTVTDNTANSNDYCGIYLHDSSNNMLTSNTASNNGVGIGLEYSSDNMLTGNNASGNGVGIGLEYSSDNTLTSNTLTSNTALGNGCGIMLGAGVKMSESVGNKTASNNFGRRSPVSSKDTLADNDASDKGYGIGLGAGVERVESTSNNTLTSNTASSNEIGIWLEYSSNNTLTSNTASNNGVGIGLEYSSDNTLTSNTANSNIAAPVLPANGGPPGSGIWMEYSSNNTLTSNTASDNSNHDIYITNSPSNTFADNTLNGTTVSFTYSGDISLKGVGLPAADPTGWHNISKFISATNLTADAWLYLNFSYSGYDLDDLVEASLTVWKHNGTRWVKDGWDNGRYLDTTGDVVGVNITTFSVFAPMGVPPLHHINVTPTSKTLGINESQDFIARGYAQDGAEISEYFVFAWACSDKYVGNFTPVNDTATNFTAEHVGITYITASNGSKMSNEVQVTVDAAEPTNVTVINGTAIVTSGDANVTCNLGDNVTGWINITAIGNATNSSEVNSSKPRYGLGSGDKVVSGVIVNVSGTIASELEKNGTIRIKICYNATTLAALGIDASTLAIWKYDNDTEKWVKQPSTRSGTCVYADVDHLCTFGLVGSKATPSGGGSSGGSGTYPPGWFGTPTPTVTATKAPAASATGATTPAPPGERVTPAPTKKPAMAKAAAPAAEGTTAGTAKKSAPGFTAIFAIAGMLAVAYAMMRRKG